MAKRNNGSNPDRNKEVETTDPNLGKGTKGSNPKLPNSVIPTSPPPQKKDSE